MKRVWLLALFAVQLAVPAGLIAKHEVVLRHGVAYRFRTQPVDPYDAMRGRYVALRFAQEENVPLDVASGCERGDRVHAVLGEDEHGFARIEVVTRDRPRDRASMPVDVVYVHQGKVRVRFPFDRFYMNEKLAPTAERAYAEATRVTATNSYAVVRVLNGTAVIEQVVVGGIPISDAARARSP